VRVVVNGWFYASLAAGSGQYLTALARRLGGIDPGHEFILVTHAGKAVNQGTAAIPHPPGWGLHVAATPLDRWGDNLAKLWFEQVTFPRACRRLGADVAWTPYWGSSWWRPCPAVVTVHDIIPLLLPQYRGGILQRAYSALVAATARRADAILTDSEASRQDIVRRLRVPSDRVHVAPLAADTAAPAPVESSGVRARYGLGDEPFLLYLGGFDVRKNLPRTLEAHAKLAGRLSREARPVPKLVVAGRLPATDSAFAPDPRPIVERLRITEHVHFAGWIDERDKPALFREALAVLFLSEYEGFGLPVLEAMAAAANQPDNTQARLENQ
jgi:glycosyltransferase involved in cell wall biosynthesis